MTPAEQIHEKILKLQELLTTQNPGIDSWLRDIHTNLHKDESLIQYLSPEEIGVIVSGLSIKAKIEIVNEAVKSKSSNKKLSTLTTNDI
jgi:hypothetical protein